MAAALQWIAKFLLIPLIKEAAVVIYKWMAQKLAQKKKEDANQVKSEAYANEKDPVASGDSFADLP
jgi:hypothetical protein